MENVSWMIILSLCASLANCLDLGPFIRIAQCRSQCLREYNTDGTKDCYSSPIIETVCSKCWQNCEDVEIRWEKTSKTICEQNDSYKECPACQTACTYRKTRVTEKYLPSMLPAPKKGPVNLDKFDVAILMRNIRGEWRNVGYYSSETVQNLEADGWIIVVMEQGMKQYSWQEWVPTLESLKKGLLYEATISWKNTSTQLKRQEYLERRRFNDKLRQSCLEEYGEKVLAEWNIQEVFPISWEIFRRYFFRKKDGSDGKISGANDSPSTNANYFDNVENISIESLNDPWEKKVSYIVSWEPETGGLIGNQVTDSNSVQISLFPGTKYLVRIASNEGPGSFPIEVDTRTDFIQVERVKTYFDYYYIWEFFIALIFLTLLSIIIFITKVLKKKKKVIIENV